MFALVVTEGLLEVPVAERLLSVLDLPYQQANFVPKPGRVAFWRDARRYNEAARHVGPVLGLADLEQEPCPSGLIEQHLPHGRHQAFVLRVAERMLESWLLADRSALAGFLRIPVGSIPGDPDSLPHPKQTLVNLARNSRRREVVADLVPKTGSAGLVGRGYVTRMTEFVKDAWRPLHARTNSDSLDRAMRAIQAAGSR